MAGGDDAGREPVVHPTAEVAEDAALGAGTRIWHQAQVMAGARLGRDCTVGKGAFVGTGTVVGDLVKIGNYANLFGPRVEDEVFIGPLVCVMEDPSPRATTPDGARQTHADFERRPATIRRGATLGAAALVLPGITIGRWDAGEDEGRRPEGGPPADGGRSPFEVGVGRRAPSGVVARGDGSSMTHTSGPMKTSSSTRGPNRLASCRS